MAMTTELIDLSRTECLALLASSSVGRVAFCGSAGPQLYLVSFVLDGSDLVFRTAAYSTLGRDVRGQRVAFEVDDLDTDHRSGWSVLVTGRAEAIDDPEEVARVQLSGDPQPWAEGTRRLYVRVTPWQLTGRRSDSRPPTMAG